METLQNDLNFRLQVFCDRTLTVVPQMDAEVHKHYAAFHRNFSAARKTSVSVNSKKRCSKVLLSFRLLSYVRNRHVALPLTLKTADPGRSLLL